MSIENIVQDFEKEGCKSFIYTDIAKDGTLSHPNFDYISKFRSFCSVELNIAGGISSFGGVHSRQLVNQPDGTILLDDIKHAIRKEDVHFPPTKLICLENTHNRCFGMPLSSNYVNSVAEVAKNNSILVHVDGARIFNAAVSLDTPVAKLTDEIDSVSFCLSKGLSAPAGSLLCGSEDFIYRARRNRKALGGGMRQAGILAAAGIIALENMTERIADDHQNARALAEGISDIKGINIDLDKIQTNIIYFSLDHPKIELK